MKTKESLLNNTRNYRRTKKGLLTNLYHKLHYRAKVNNIQSPNFTLEFFHNWLLDNAMFDEMYKQWVCSGYKRDFRPSVDRIDPLKGYEFANISIVPYLVNRRKGDKEKLLLWGKPVYQCDMQGEVIAVHQSIKEASELTGINKNNISSCLHGKRNHAGKFRWFFENPELLEATK